MAAMRQVLTRAGVSGDDIRSEDFGRVLIAAINLSQRLGFLGR